MSQPIFLLFDGHAVIYRAFYAFPGLTNPAGQLVNAVYGFARIVLTTIRDYEPTYAALTFDHPTKTFRHKEFADYKAQRAEMPDELKPQIEIVKQVVKSLNIPQFEVPGFEADDLIGTISSLIDDHRVKSPSNLLTVIVTGDRDTLQLVDDNTHVWLPGRKTQGDQELDANAVEVKMGVRPSQIIDLKALMGDSSDNIPGIAGVGPKTASTLIKKFGSLKALYTALESAKVSGEKIAGISEKLVDKLIQGKESAYLSQKLATIERNVPLPFDLESCRVTGYKKDEVVELFKQLDFQSLIHLLPADSFESDVQQALF